MDQVNISDSTHAREFILRSGFLLKGISKIISPELLKTLCEMGHGDEIVIADGNFPAETFGKRVIRADGIGGAAFRSEYDFNASYGMRRRKNQSRYMG